MRSATHSRTWFDGGLHARQNPYLWMVGLAMGSSGILFMFLLSMLLVRKFTTGLPPIPIPWAFYVSTGALSLSSALLLQARSYFRKEQYVLHTRLTLYTFALGLTFVLLQLMGWWQLYAWHYLLQDNPSAAFLYILSGLHILHMLVALGIMLWVLLDSLKSKTYVDGYLQGFQPAKRTRLLLANWLWHFADILWLLLFLVFLAFLSA